MFPERLTKLRKEKKLSKTYMGELLGITRQAYSKYEEDKSEPDIKTINKLSTFFDVDTDFLLGKTNERKRGSDSELESALDDPDFEIFYKELKGSPEENRKKALEFLKFLNEQEKK